MTEKIIVTVVLRKGEAIIVSDKGLLHLTGNITKSMPFEENVEYIILRG